LKQMHFTYDEWQAFKENSLTPEKSAAMEIHLQDCETCQELYLSLIEPYDLDLVQTAIPLDFTETLMSKLDKQTATIIKIPAPKPILKRKSIFAYYVTAAAVTLALMNGGVFDSMVDQSMHFSKACMIQSQNIETQVSRDWRSQLLKDNSAWMDKFSFAKERNVKNAK